MAQWRHHVPHRPGVSDHAARAGTSPARTDHSLHKPSGHPPPMPSSPEPTPADRPADTGAFRLVPVWQALTAEEAAAIRAFWQQQQAIAHAEDAEQRLRQVVLYAATREGAIAGVVTALPMLPPRFGQPMYYLRTFVGRAWRTTPLVREMTIRACHLLDAYARERSFPCIGVLVELENARFAQALRRPVWHHPRFHYVGLSPRGLEMRALYFEGARLKTPDELQRLQLPSH